VQAMTDLFTKEKWKRKKRCYHTHKPLKFGDGVLLGASCSSPRGGYDIYIGFDWGMEFNHSNYPWQSEEDSIVEFLFKITDRGVPRSPKLFKEMVTWICNQLDEGKKIHMGCIGGHGRTGLVIAAVKAVWDGELDAINWVRENYCKNAVESRKQVKFLGKHFGIKAAEAIDLLIAAPQRASKRRSKFRGVKVVPLHKVSCIPGKGSIWG